MTLLSLLLSLRMLRTLRGTSRTSPDQNAFILLADGNLEAADSAAYCLQCRINKLLRMNGFSSSMLSIPPHKRLALTSVDCY